MDEVTQVVPYKKPESNVITEQTYTLTKPRTVPLGFECLKILSKEEYVIIKSHQCNLPWSFV